MAPEERGSPARRTIRLHVERDLTPERLRAINARQTALLSDAFQRLEIAPAVAALVDISPERRAGFIAIRTPYAAPLVAALRTRAVFSDSRGSLLRLGPAPYVSDAQLHRGMEHLAEALADLNPSD
jgi:kynureninase